MDDQTIENDCLWALLHWRERPHTKVVLAGAGVVHVQCHCARMSGARYLVELWSRDTSLSQRVESSRLLSAHMQGQLDREHCIGIRCPASHRTLVLSPVLANTPGDHLLLKKFVAKCLSQRLWRSLELCFRDVEGNIRTELCNVLPELMSTMQFWVTPSEYAMLQVLLLRRPDWAVVTSASLTHQAGAKSAAQSDKVKLKDGRGAATVSLKPPDSARPQVSTTVYMS